jgi:hypothetical protein
MLFVPPSIFDLKPRLLLQPEPGGKTRLQLVSAGSFGGTRTAGGLPDAPGGLALADPTKSSKTEIGKTRIILTLAILRLDNQRHKPIQISLKLKLAS